MENVTQTPSGLPRPGPLVNAGALSFSTKKERTAPRLRPPKKPLAKSHSVTRAFPHRRESIGLPLPVSFNSESNTSFIANSTVYQAEQCESYFEQCFSIKKVLGHGFFGEVYKVLSKEDGKIYACKKSLEQFRGDSDRRRKMAEVAKHEKLPKHRNCLEFFRAWEEDKHLYILTEICTESLANLAERGSGKLPECVIWNYALDLLQAVEHLHRHSLVHMDIKLENIFLSSDGVCKLGDFGLMFDMAKDNLKEVMEGDPKYMAPECMASNFGPPADIFSVGVSLLELALDLDLPASGPTWHALRNQKMPDSFKELSEELQCMLKGLLHPDPKLRLTASQALSIPQLVSLRRSRSAARLLNTSNNLLVMVMQWVMQWLLHLLAPTSRQVARCVTRLFRSPLRNCLTTPQRPEASRLPQDTLGVDNYLGTSPELGRHLTTDSIRTTLRRRVRDDDQCLCPSLELPVPLSNSRRPVPDFASLQPKMHSSPAVVRERSSRTPLSGVKRLISNSFSNSSNPLDGSFSGRSSVRTPLAKVLQTNLENLPSSPLNCSQTVPLGQMLADLSDSDSESSPSMSRSHNNSSKVNGSFYGSGLHSVPNNGLNSSHLNLCSNLNSRLNRSNNNIQSTMNNNLEDSNGDANPRSTNKLSITISDLNNSRLKGFDTPYNKCSPEPKPHITQSCPVILPRRLFCDQAEKQNFFARTDVRTRIASRAGGRLVSAFCESDDDADPSIVPIESFPTKNLLSDFNENFSDEDE